MNEWMNECGCSVAMLDLYLSQYHFIFNPPNSDKSAGGRVSRQIMMRALSLHHMFYCLWRYASCLSLALKDTFMNLLQCLLLLLLLPLWQWRNKKIAAARLGVWGRRHVLIPRTAVAFNVPSLCCWHKIKRGKKMKNRGSTWKCWLVT